MITRGHGHSDYCKYRPRCKELGLFRYAKLCLVGGVLSKGDVK